MRYLGSTLKVGVNNALVMISTHLPNLRMLDISCNSSSNEAHSVDINAISFLAIGIPTLTHLGLSKVSNLKSGRAQIDISGV